MSIMQCTSIFMIVGFGSHSVSCSADQIQQMLHWWNFSHLTEEPKLVAVEWFVSMIAIDHYKMKHGMDAIKVDCTKLKVTEQLATCQLQDFREELVETRK